MRIRIAILVVAVLVLLGMWLMPFLPLRERQLVRIRRASDGSVVQTLTGHTGTIWSVAYSPTGEFVASADGDQTIWVWRVRSSRRLTRFTSLRLRSDGASVAFSADGRLLAGGSSGHVVIWKMPQWTLAADIKHGIGWRTPVAFSPDGKLIAATGKGGNVLLMRAPSGEIVRSLKNDAKVIYSLAFAPNGKLLAVGDSRGIVELWNTADGRCISALKDSEGAVRSVAFSPDGRLLASTKGDAIMIWRVPDGQLARVLKGYTSMITTVSFSPDSQRLAASGTEPAVWRIADGKQLFVIPADRMNCLTFSPDGRYLVCGEWTGPHH